MEYIVTYVTIRIHFTASSKAIRTIVSIAVPVKWSILKDITTQ